MKIKIFITVFLLIFFGAFTSAIACDPDPPCEEWNSGGHIDGGQWQNQSHHNFSFGPNGMGSGGCQDQGQWTHGSGGFTGTIDMTQSQFDTYDFSSETANHWGNLYQDEHTWGTVIPGCDLRIFTHQNQNGGSVTNHSDDSMVGCQHISASAFANIEGAPGTVGTDMFQGQTHGYYHGNGPSWQGATITTTTSLKHGTPPSTP